VSNPRFPISAVEWLSEILARLRTNGNIHDTKQVIPETPTLILSQMNAETLLYFVRGSNHEKIEAECPPAIHVINIIQNNCILQV